MTWVQFYRTCTGHSFNRGLEDLSEHATFRDVFHQFSDVVSASEIESGGSNILVLLW